MFSNKRDLKDNELILKEKMWNRPQTPKAPQTTDPIIADKAR